MLPLRMLYLHVFRWVSVYMVKFRYSYKVLGQRSLHKRTCICLRIMYWCFLCLKFESERRVHEREEKERIVKETAVMVYPSLFKSVWSHITERSVGCSKCSLAFKLSFKEEYFSWKLTRCLILVVWQAQEPGMISKYTESLNGLGRKGL